MARKSAEALAAELWRMGPKLPQPPRGLRGPARKYWATLIVSKPRDHWSGASLLLLHRLCQSAATAAVVQHRLDEDPVGPASGRLTRQISMLNSSVSALARQLRLTPQTTISARSTGRNAETGIPPHLARLIGGRAVHGPRAG